MLRRTKDEVLKDLPPKRKIIVPMEVDEVAIKNYNTASAEFIEWIQNHQTAGLALQENVDRLKQLAYIAKRNSVISWLEQYLESDNKLVVGLYHKHAMEDLLNHFKKISVYIDGSVTGQKRQDAVDAFQNDKKVKLIFCQLLTVPGLTLTAAPATCTIEFSWAPADHLQFEDRVHRIGQEADSVTAYYLIAPNTIDEESMAMVNNKFTVLTQVMDGKENADIFEDSFLKQILKKYSKKRL
jgi:SNF2 family DNA or RNA helicase